MEKVNKLQDVSKDFVWNAYDAAIGKQLIRLEATPSAIVYFSRVCDNLTDYGYWFYLSTLWVSYSGWSDLNLWKELFSSNRPKRKTSIMKPSELKQFKKLPPVITAYRAHRENETDWISYTLNLTTAKRFARERNVTKVSKYLIKKKDVLALFTRRGEDEILLIDKTKALYQENIFI